MMKLTGTEKDAIRNSPCGTCGDVPPFPDGSRCHPHRLDPKKGYVAGNVVPRCPDCHSKEPGHNAWTRYARAAARKGALITNASMLPAQRAARSRKAGLKGSSVLKERHRMHGLTQKEHAQRAMLAKANASKGGLAFARLPAAQRSASARKANDRLSTGQRSARARRGWITRRNLLARGGALAD